MDINGYPEERELKEIHEWPYKDFISLMEYVKERWRYTDDGFWRVEGNEYHISTGGWSGNESIIGALKENLMFWSMCWMSSRRGGHYVFEVKVLG